ncbi:hypothetical protein JCM8547_005693 [Rhodosporidiobolus lusitaniae]
MARGKMMHRRNEAYEKWLVDAFAETNKPWYELHPASNFPTYASEYGLKLMEQVREERVISLHMLIGFCSKHGPDTILMRYLELSIAERIDMLLAVFARWATECETIECPYERADAGTDLMLDNVVDPLAFGNMLMDLSKACKSDNPARSVPVHNSQDWYRIADPASSTRLLATRWSMWRGDSHSLWPTSG